MRELHKKMVHLGVNILNIKKAWERGFFDRPIYKGEKNKGLDNFRGIIS